METPPKKKGNNNVIWIALLIIIVVVIIWLYNKKPSSNFGAPETTVTGTGSTAATTTYVTVTDNTVLKQGMENDYVLKLQQLINKVNTTYGLPKITEDGDFGSGTAAALKKLTGKSEMSYADAELAAREKFEAKGYGETFIDGMLSGVMSIGGLFGM